MTSITHRLIMRSGPTPEKVFELTAPVIWIGRDYANEVVINDAEVSRKHSRLTAQSGGFILEDMGSTNGTFVNGQRLLGPHLLRPGELISFGEKVSLAYEVLQYDPNATVATPVSLPPYSTPDSFYNSANAQPASQSQPYAQPQPQANQVYPAAVPPAAETRQAYSPPPAAQAAPAYYSGQIPESPGEVVQPEERRSGSRNLVLLGIGCLVVFLCVCVGVAVVFDQLNLYCVPPFGSLFNWLYTCP